MKEVAASTFAVAAVLLVIITSGRFVKYLAQSARGDFPADLIFNLMVFRLPSFMELILPLSLFIGILLAYGRMYMDSEMTVLRSCGFSTQRLIAYTMAPAAIITVLVLILSLFVSPMGINKVQRMLKDAGAARNVEGLLQAEFQIDKDSGRVTYFEKQGEGRAQMQHVFIARKVAGKERELEIVVSEQGHIRREDDSRMVVLDKGYRYIGEPGELDYSITQFDEMGQRVFDASPNSYNLKEDALSTQELLQNQKRKQYRATLYWRFALIILVPVVALLALSFSRTNPRRGRYAAMFPAFIVYLLYLVALNAARDFVEKGGSFPSFALWWVHIPFILLAWIMLKGAEYRQLWRHRRSAA
jgi:lipopolysaccharide export system permease protein